MSNSFLISLENGGLYSPVSESISFSLTIFLDPTILSVSITTASSVITSSTSSIKSISLDVIKRLNLT